MFSDAGARHTAIVTGANHGIGAATAQALARHGAAVLCTFLRVEDQPDPGTPQAYRDNRARDAAAVVARRRDHAEPPGGGFCGDCPRAGMNTGHNRL